MEQTYPAEEEFPSTRTFSGHNKNWAFQENDDWKFPRAKHSIRLNEKTKTAFRVHYSKALLQS